MWANSGGAQWISGQTQDQNMDLGRRGVGRNNIDGLGPTGLAGKPPPSGGGGGGVSAVQQQWCALQPSFEGCGAQGKNGKNVETVGFQT